MTLGEQIRYFRKQAGKTQQELAEKLFVSFEAVSNWERGTNIPSADNLQRIAEVLNVTVDTLLGDNRFEVKEKLFDDDLATFISAKLDENYPMSIKSLQHIRESRKDEKRKSKGKVPYEFHPLLMARQAFALNIADDELVAALFLHDVFDIPDMRRIDIPREVSEDVLDACELLARKGKDNDEYFEGILQNPLACMVKLFARCSNLSSMPTGVEKTHMAECVKETEEYFGKLFDAVDKEPKWRNASWLLRYQINALVEVYKKLL